MYRVGFFCSGWVAPSTALDSCLIDKSTIDSKLGFSESTFSDDSNTMVAVLGGWGGLMWNICDDASVYDSDGTATSSLTFGAVLNNGVPTVETRFTFVGS